MRFEAASRSGSSRHGRSIGRHSSLILMTALALALGGLVAPHVASAAVGVPVTYLDHTYASARPPSADKPQSKLWYHDGSWWALMVEAGGTKVYIHELLSDHTWRNTGTLVDSRSEGTGDALMSHRDGMLYVASRAPGVNVQVNAFTYNGSTRAWSVATGFPVDVSSGGSSESTTIDQDSTGRLWVTYTRAQKVWVAYSDVSGRNWTAGFVPTGGDTDISADDLSALIAFNGSIGVLYSDQAAGAFRFAIHRDGAPVTEWSFETFTLGPTFADDHINLKQIAGDPQGRIFAAIKTSNGDVSTDPADAPLVGVLSRTAAGAWSFATAGTVADDHTRPMIMIDSTNQELYFFATAPVSGGDIFYKKTPLSNVDFSAQPGRGTPFVDATPVVNNASGAKDPVTAESGLVLLAVAHGKKQYVHAEMQLAGGGGAGGGTGDSTAPTVTATSPGPDATGVDPAADVTATFSEDVQGVSGTTFTLEDSSTGAGVAATVSYSAASRVARLDPSVTLAAGTRYTVTLTGGVADIRDTAGNPLTTSSWSFTTASATPGDPDAPTVTQVTPGPDATAVWLATNVTATFSEAVTGVSPSTFTLTNTSTGAQVAGALSQPSARKWLFNPSANLSPDTRYTVRLVGGPTAIRDASGHPLVTFEWSFLTGPAPKVSRRTPAVDATGVSRTTNVTATFNEAVQGVSGATFLLTDPAGGAVPAAVSRVGTTNRYLLDPNGTLAARTTYTVTVVGGASGVKDLAGNPLATTVTWSFTTGS